LLGVGVDTAVVSTDWLLIDSAASTGWVGFITGEVSAMGCRVRPYTQLDTFLSHNTDSNNILNHRKDVFSV